MNTILYQNNPISDLRTDETNALVKLAPYWGLLFDEHHLTVEPGLSSQTVCIQNINEEDLIYLKDILFHTGIHFVEKDSNSALLLQVHTEIEKQPTPIILTVGNIKYRIKPTDKVSQSLQKVIHRNIWLPIRDLPITITFHDMTVKERSESIAYLILQHFLRKHMAAISHIPLESYSSLIEKVLNPINPSFASLQEKNHQNMWPEIPPEIIQNDPNKSDQIIKSTFNPFKHQSPSSYKQINPFETSNKQNSHTINPFKRKT